MWTDLGNNFFCDCISIHPTEWLERVNRHIYQTINKKGHLETRIFDDKFKLLWWTEILEENYQKIEKISVMGDFEARRNLEASYKDDELKLK
jgi:hypothetical protein